MSDVKVQITSENGRQVDDAVGDMVIVAALERDQYGNPQHLQTRLVGKATPADMIMMAQAVLDHIEDMIRKHINDPEFDIRQAMRMPSPHRTMEETEQDMLAALDPRTATRH